MWTKKNLFRPYTLQSIFSGIELTLKNHVKDRKKLDIIKGRIPLKMHIILSILVENLIKMLWLNVMV